MIMTIIILIAKLFKRNVITFITNNDEKHNLFIIVDNPYLAFATLTHIFEKKILSKLSASAHITGDEAIMFIFR